jgi:cobalamin biosynthesis Mg chelatase CobN
MADDPEVLRAEIVQKRAELGETAEALAAKADVKARVTNAAHERIDHVKATAQEKVDSIKATAQGVKQQVVQTATQTADAARVEAANRAGAVRNRISDFDLDEVRRSPVSPAVIGAAGLVVVAIAVIAVWRRRRS